MRLLLASLMLLGWSVALAASAQAAGLTSPYDEVPTTHWAYHALACMTGEGVLQDYPADYFDGDRPLTRYDFANATARLLATLDKNGSTHEDAVLADSLRSEFAAELAAVEQPAAALASRSQAQQEQLDGLSYKADGTAARIAPLEQRLMELRDGPQWHGAFTYRWQVDSRRGPATTDSFQQRIGLSLDYEQRLSAELSLKVSLVTRGDSLFGYDHLRGLGHAGTLSASQVDVDEAYVKYTPRWGGTYAAAGGRAPRVELLAGQFASPVHDSVLDSADADR